MAFIEFLPNILALIIALIVPGYFLTLAFFPSKTQIDGIERLTFSLLFSIVFMPLVVLLANQLLGVPINFVSSFGTMILLIALGAIVYLIRIQAIGIPKSFERIFSPIEKNDAFNLLFWKN